jgi:hypothetical protein
VLSILHKDAWVEEIGDGLTELRVRVRQPAVEHRVRIKISGVGSIPRAKRRESAP